jgi:hypothetical protein
MESLLYCKNSEPFYTGFISVLFRRIWKYIFAMFASFLGLALDRTTFAINGCPVTQPEGGALTSSPCSLDDLYSIETTRKILGESAGVATIKDGHPG